MLAWACFQLYRLFQHLWIISSGSKKSSVVNVQIGSHTIFSLDPHRMHVLAEKVYILMNGSNEYQSHQYRRNLGLIRLKTPLVYKMETYLKEFQSGGGPINTRKQNYVHTRMWNEVNLPFFSTNMCGLCPLDTVCLEQEE